MITNEKTLLNELTGNPRKLVSMEELIKQNKSFFADPDAIEFAKLLEEHGKQDIERQALISRDEPIHR